MTSSRQSVTCVPSSISPTAPSGPNARNELPAALMESVHQYGTDYWDIPLSEGASATLAFTGTTTVKLLNNDAQADPRWIEAGLAAMDRQHPRDLFDVKLLLAEKL